VRFGAHENWFSLPSFFYETLILVVFVTSVMFVYLSKVNKPLYFVQLYLLTMTVKIIAYGAYVYFMITRDQRGTFVNVVFFLISYLLFTTLEIVFLYRKISPSHNEHTQAKKF